MKNLVIHNVEQRSKEWEMLRHGKIGGSDAIGLTTPARRKTLLPKIVSELETDEPEENYVSKNMQHGIDEEPYAIAAYEKEYFTEVTQIGYLTNTRFKYFGCSPDGVIYNKKTIEKGIEVKCPEPKKHVEVIIKNEVPKEYRPQIAQMFVIMEDLKEVDFISFCRKVKRKPVFVVNCKREDFEKDISAHEKDYIEMEKKIEQSIKLFE